MKKGEKNNKINKPLSLFRARVLKIVAAIPRGKVLTYTEVARRAGNAKAARAVGAIMRTNYNPKVPCHRVIRTDGTFGGYNRGGTSHKKQLLMLEGALPIKN